MEPHAQVDDSPLHSHMDKNKESLKVKLMLRRPINQLVAQGIMPPLKTPPGFHEQRQKLERAKMGDLLKAKIQQRPDREELVRQHILEDVGHVDPSLAEKQRQLKKCRLADALNDQLSHRPGPLELIKKNILHTEPPIERAIKEGAIEFKATCEGTATKPTHPDHYMLDEDSSGSLSPPPSSVTTQASSPSSSITQASTPAVVSSGDEAVVTSTTSSSGPSQVVPQAAATAAAPGIVTVLLTSPSTAIAIPAMAYRGATASLSPSQQLGGSSSSSSSSSSSKDKSSRKKSKAKATSKPRIIKFHEYKGPPNAQKILCQQSNPVETSYDLLLQQQQLFLQWQLEWQHKYPQILLPASRRPTTPPPSTASSSSSNGDTSSTTNNAPPPPPLPQSSPPPPPPPLRNLEDMKVSDLKAELKKRNLPVSGPKPQLIERLKPYSESAQLQAQNSASSAQQVTSTTGGIQEESIPSASPSVQTQSPLIKMEVTDSPHSPSSPASSVASTTTTVATATPSSTTLIKVENTFQATSPQQQSSATTTSNAKASLAAFLQQQQLNQQLLNQQNNNNNNNNNINNDNNNVTFGVKQEVKKSPMSGPLPNFMGTFMNNGSNDLMQQGDSDSFIIDNKGLFDLKSSDLKQNEDPMLDVKSQIVDDVLEILIKNGELPASAAAQPLELSELCGDMDVDHPDLMEVDTDWLDSLICGTSGVIDSSHSFDSSHAGAATSPPSSSTTAIGNNDPLLCGVLGSNGSPSPFDLFIDDSEFNKLTTSGLMAAAGVGSGLGGSSDWDRLDFAI